MTVPSVRSSSVAFSVVLCSLACDRPLSPSVEEPADADPAAPARGVEVVVLVDALLDADLVSRTRIASGTATVRDVVVRSEAAARLRDAGDGAEEALLERFLEADDRTARVLCACMLRDFGHTDSLVRLLQWLVESHALPRGRDEVDHGLWNPSRYVIDWARSTPEGADTVPDNDIDAILAVPSWVPKLRASLSG